MKLSDLLLIRDALGMTDSGDYDHEGLLQAMQDYPVSQVYAGVNPNDHLMHLTDLFKQSNHPSFSNESMYARGGTQDAGEWIGGEIPGKPGLESWQLRGKNGDVYTTEAPWVLGGILHQRRKRGFE